ncbi:MAG TPA: hypothetical protein VFQ45_22460 [Longimicrobium sp.]|nr:hypothetical protein [Longimicrobium sp.]
MRRWTLITAGLLLLTGGCAQPVAAPEAGAAAAIPARDEAPAPQTDAGGADPQSQGYYGSGHGDPPPDSVAPRPGDGGTG